MPYSSLSFKADSRQDFEEGSFQDSLPPVSVAVYDRSDLVLILSITLSDICNFIIEIPTPYGGRVNNLQIY